MNCKNCELHLEENTNYCSDCGAKVIRNRLTIRNLFEHITETFFNYDNKLLRTLRDLTVRPQIVIDDYVSGVRMRYVNPISLFALVLTISGISLFILQKFYADALDLRPIMEQSGIYTEEMLDQLDESTGSVMEYSSLIYSAMVPVFALISALIFYDKRYNLTEHVIIYLYSMSILSLFSVVTMQLVLMINSNWYWGLSLLIWPIMFVYHSFLLKKLFKLTGWELVLRGMMALFLFIASYIGIVLIGVAVAIISKQF